MSISRDCMSDRIKRVILERISNGTYSPGERLVELQIAKEFETSQAPIREALCELEAMRIVETQPYKGTRVREVSEKELYECIQIRAALEMLAAEQVEDRILENLESLRQKALRTVEAAKERDVRAYSKANLEFHRAIVLASGNETLLMVWDSLAPEVRMVASAQKNSDKLREGANDHLDIVDAFAEGDNRLAGRLLKKHAELALIKNLARDRT